MPREVDKLKKNCGFQQRKLQKAREEALKEYEGSMLRFVELEENLSCQTMKPVFLKATTQRTFFGSNPAHKHAYIDRCNLVPNA